MPSSTDNVVRLPQQATQAVDKYAAILERLRPNIGRASDPNPFELSGLVRCLERLAVTPCVKEDIDRHQETARPHRERHHHRNVVQGDLKAEQDWLDHIDPQGLLGDRKRQIESAIAALEALDASEFIWDADFFGRTRRYKPWTVAVREIGQRLLAVLRSTDQLAGLPQRAGFTKADVDFVERSIVGRIGADEAPSREQVIEVLKQVAPVNLPRGRPGTKQKS
jgi:hypothetical protein